MHSKNYIRNALTLGLITAIGPFAVDMYLPALPSIGTGFGVESNVVVLSMTAFFLSFGLFQIVFGTLADVAGRKLPLYIGIGLFIAAGMGCALAGDIHTLIALRFIQGIGGAASVIVPRAIVRDLYRGVEEVKMMSLLMLVFSVSPLLAPLAGSFIINASGWRAVFWMISLLGFAGLMLLAFGVRETLPKEKRIKSDLKTMATAYRSLFADKAFMGMTFIGTFSITAFFIYLGNSAFALRDYYHFTPMQYSLAFSCNALAFFMASQFNSWLGKKFGMARVMLPAALCFSIVMTAAAILFWLGVDNFWIISVLLFISFSFVGILLPTVMVLSLEKHGDIAGTAASFMNTAQLLIGALIMGAGGSLIKGNILIMLAMMAMSSLICLGFTLWTFRQPKQKAVTEAA